MNCTGLEKSEEICRIEIFTASKVSFKDGYILGGHPVDVDDIKHKMAEQKWSDFVSFSSQVIQTETSQGSCPIRLEQSTRFSGTSGCDSCSHLG